MNALAPITNLPEKLRLRVADFVLLEESGAFRAFSKAELIDGDIIIVNAQYARHGLTKTRLLYALKKRLEEGGSALDVYSEVSLRVAPDAMPEPDLFLAPPQGFGPVPVAGVALVVEVSDTTLRTDLGRKAELYAGAGIPEYWVVDLDGGRVVLHVAPRGGVYGRREEVALCGPIRSLTIDGLDTGEVRLID